jgi:hypothetical protein
VSAAIPGSAKPAKKKKKRALLFDILAVLVCLAGACAAFYFFWQDLNRSLTKLELPIASVHFKDKTAQRRFGDRIVWDMLKQASPIYSGDVIHTSDLSQATINFDNPNDLDDLTSFDLGENSLIQVFADRIELASGTINIRTNSSGAKLKLVSSGTVVNIAENSVVSANSAQAGGGNVVIAEGRAQIITSEGTQEVSAGEAMAVSAEGRTEQYAQAIPLTPLPNQRVFMSGGGTDGRESVAFTWRAIYFSPENFVRFEIAADQRFTQLINSAEVRSAAERTSALAPGVYWWRVYPVTTADDSVPDTTVANKLTIFDAAPPTPVAPQDGSTITYRTTIPPVRLQWSVNNAADADIQFELTVADNPSMTDARVSTTLNENSFTVNDLDSGLWYWQVRALYADTSGRGETARAASRLSSFSLRQSYGQLLAPRLTSPPDGATIIPAAAAPELFSWRAESEAASYSLQIANGSEFTGPQINQTTNDNYYNLTLAGDTAAAAAAAGASRLPDGVYFWRVSWTDGTGTASPYSPPRSFTLSSRPPPAVLVYPPDNVTLSDSSLTGTRFTWTMAAGTTAGQGQARWQIAQAQTFSSFIVDIPVSRTEINGQILPAGIYYWRISVPSASGDFETAPRRFTVNASSKIILEAPANNAEIPGLAALRTPPSLNWSSTEPVVSSRLLLSTSPNPSAPDAVLLLNIANPGRSARLPPLGEGVYYWTVQAESTGGVNISPVSASAFRVGAVPLLAAPTLQSPANNFAFTAAALRQNKSIRFAWQGVSGANAYILSIYRAADTRGAAPVYRSAALRQTNITLENLTILDAGNFIWSVEPLALSAEGSIEQHGTPRESVFTIRINIPASPSLSDEETYGDAP